MERREEEERLAEEEIRREEERAIEVNEHTKAEENTELVAESSELLAVQDVSDSHRRFLPGLFFGHPLFQSN